MLQELFRLIAGAPSNRKTILLSPSKRIGKLQTGLQPRGVEHLIHGARRLRTAGFADDFGGDAGHGHIVRHRPYHHRARGYPGTMTDLDIAEYLCARSDHDTTANLGMAVLVLLAGPAKRDAMQDRDVILDNSGFTADETGGVVQKDTPTDPGGRIDIGLKHR